MKKTVVFFALLIILLVPQLAMGDIVPCGNVNPDGTIPNPCTLLHIFVLMVNVFNFLVLYIATPLATLMIAIGGVLILISGGNPGMASSGKGMIKIAVIAILLIWGSYLIIATLLNVIGYGGGVNPPF